MTVSVSTHYMMMHLRQTVLGLRYQQHMAVVNRAHIHQQPVTDSSLPSTQEGSSKKVSTSLEIFTLQGFKCTVHVLLQFSTGIG